MTQVGTGCQLDPGLRRDDDMADSPPTEGGPRSGGEGQNGGKSIRVKIAKARAHWDSPQFYPLQENQGFFATHFFTKMKKIFGGFPQLFDF